MLDLLLRLGEDDGVGAQPGGLVQHLLLHGPIAVGGVLDAQLRQGHVRTGRDLLQHLDLSAERFGGNCWLVSRTVSTPVQPVSARSTASARTG
jgi:hypothetical protein